MNELGIWGLLGLVTAATYVWRGTGVAIVARITPSGDFTQWTSCVAYGMLAGLMSRIMVMPVGILAETPLADRLVALAAGYLVFFAFQRNMLPAMIAAVTIFLALTGSRSFGVF